MEKKYKFGILGTGRMAGKMAEAFPFVAGATIGAVASRSQKSADRFAQQYGIGKAYNSYEAMMADPDIDVVFVATPHNLHHQNTLMSLNAGKHVLCEKPFAVNGREVREMIDMAREKNLFLMEALWSRFLPNIIKAKEIVESGKIGKIKLLKSHFYIKPDFNPQGRLFNKELIGGSLMDLGIYPVFLAMYLMGKPQRIASLAGIGATGVDFSCSMTFGYPDEAMAVLHSSLICSAGTSAVVEGEKGTIIFDNWWHTPTNFSVVDGDGNITPYTFEFAGNGYNYELEEVVRCLNNRQTESNIMSWQTSLELIDTLDVVRKQCQIVYPGHDEIMSGK